MKHDALSLEQALAAAIGDNPTLFAELRTVFLESSVRHGMALLCARDAQAWHDAAWRLKGAAASFGATELMAAADIAGIAPVGDPQALAGVGQALAALED